MTTIVGIFDTARDLDEAVERLAEAGIEDTVFDEAIEAGNVGPARGVVKADLPAKPDRHTDKRHSLGRCRPGPGDGYQSFSTSGRSN